MLAAVRLQAIVRGFLERRRYRVMKMTCDVQSKYFKQDEAKETLQGSFKGHDTPLTNRVHTYTTGAVYVGQWMGGMRHGQGKMTWKDGASYEGQWQFNMACGDGKFFHTDGDIYAGQWLNNKANGFGIYTNLKGAKYEGNWKEDQ